MKPVCIFLRFSNFSSVDSIYKLNYHVGKNHSAQITCPDHPKKVFASKKSYIRHLRNPSLHPECIQQVVLVFLILFQQRKKKPALCPQLKVLKFMYLKQLTKISNWMRKQSKYTPIHYFRSK